MTKSGGQSPAPNSGGLVPPPFPAVIYAHDCNVQAGSPIRRNIYTLHYVLEVWLFHV